MGEAAALADLDLRGGWFDIDEFDRVGKPNSSGSDRRGRTYPLARR
jgi:hypothetical protein